MSAPNAITVDQFKEGLAQALRRGGFEIVHRDGERFLRPVLTGMIDELISEVPLLSIDDVARDLERFLS